MVHFLGGGGQLGGICGASRGGSWYMSGGFNSPLQILNTFCFVGLWDFF